MLITLFFVLAVAQDTIPSRHLALEDLYRSAGESSARIAAARASATAARARVPAAKLPPDPQIQLGVMNYGLGDFAPMEPLGMTQLQVMQMIPAPGTLELRGRAEAADAGAAGDRARDVEWQVRSEVAMAFYDLYAIHGQFAVGRETLRLLQEARATTEAMYRVGQGRLTDVLRAQVEIGRMIEDTMRMTAMRVGMVGTLNALLDRDAGTVVPEPLLPDFPGSVPAVAAMLEESGRGRSMHRAAEREVDGAMARAALAKRELWPEMSIGIQYGQSRGMDGGTERMGSLMVGASLPVFARKRQGAARDEALALRRMAEADLAELRARTRADVMVAHASLTRARSLATLYRGTIIPQAEAAAASALASYRVGTVDFMTLLDDRMTVNKYRQELYALEAEQGKAWADLEMLLGRELFDPRAVRLAREDRP